LPELKNNKSSLHKYLNITNFYESVKILELLTVILTEMINLFFLIL
jgi:hypothetical protein